MAATAAWDGAGGPRRADILEAASDLFERDRAKLMGMMVREAGKTLDAAQSELREAVDFLRYYAQEARRHFSGPTLLKGPTGERNTLTLRARGPFACISPWNFPLAIFTGQIAAALAAGNPVLAKPAEQTPITAYLAARLAYIGLRRSPGAAPPLRLLVPWQALALLTLFLFVQISTPDASQTLSRTAPDRQTKSEQECRGRNDRRTGRRIESQ